MDREFNYISDMNGDLEQYLRSIGYSTRICTALKKELGLVLVNDIPVIVRHIIKVGDRITVHIKETPREVPRYDAPLDIIYQDEDIAIINKTPDIAVISTHAHYGKSLMNVLANEWGDFVYHPVNRLDRGTSGLMLVAKNALAHSILSRGIEIANKNDTDISCENKSVLREYLAIVYGEMPTYGEIVAPIGQPYTDSQKRGVSDDGKYAKTLYQTLDTNGKYSLVKLQLVTGRTHQIRVHMSYINHSLVGDDLYGGDTEYINRPCLHSVNISFIHPITSQLIYYTAPPPEDMLNVMALVGLKYDEHNS